MMIIRIRSSELENKNFNIKWWRMLGKYLFKMFLKKCEFFFLYNLTAKIFSIIFWNRKFIEFRKSNLLPILSNFSTMILWLIVLSLMWTYVSSFVFEYWCRIHWNESDSKKISLYLVFIPSWLLTLRYDTLQNSSSTSWSASRLPISRRHFVRIWSCKLLMPNSPNFILTDSSWSTPDVSKSTTMFWKEKIIHNTHSDISFQGRSIWIAWLREGSVDAKTSKRSRSRRCKSLWL